MEIKICSVCSNSQPDFFCEDCYGCEDCCVCDSEFMWIEVE